MAFARRPDLDTGPRIDRVNWHQCSLLLHSWLVASPAPLSLISVRTGLLIRTQKRKKCSRIDGLDVIGSIEELESMSWCTRLVAVPETVRRLNALVELYFVDPANDNTGAEEAAEIGTPTALPCFGGGSGETPSSPCPEPRSRNLRGRR